MVVGIHIPQEIPAGTGPLRHSVGPSHGMILGKNPHYVGNVETEEEKQALIDKYGNQALRPSVKMSKSLGNVVNPDDVIRDYGALWWRPWRRNR